MLRIPIVNYKSLREGSYLSSLDRSTLPQSKTRGLKKNNHGYFPSALVPKFPSSSARRMAAQCCAAICSAWVVIWPKAQYGLSPVPPNRDALIPLFTLLDWILRTCATQSELYVAERLKGLAAWWRFQASEHQLWPAPKPLYRMVLCRNNIPALDLIFRGSLSTKATPGALIRLSRFARALPAGGPLVTEQNMEEHKRLMQIQSVPIPGLANIFSNVAEKVSRDSLESVGRPGFELSFSSCYEKTIAEGGAASVIRDLLWKTPSTHDQITYGDPDQFADGFSAFVYEGLPHEVKFVRRVTYEATELAAFGPSAPPSTRVSRPKHKVIGVPDRGGFKVRIITACEAALQSLAHGVRRVMYKSVLVHLPTRHSFVENGLKRWFHSLKFSPERAKEMNLGEWVALSSDLKSATDLFPQYLVEAINDGFERNLSSTQISSSGWQAWRSLSGPQHLIYPDGTELDTSAGNLMGTSPSWTHLNIFNVSLFRAAWSIWTRPACRKGILWNQLRRCRKRSSIDPALWLKLKERVKKIIAGEAFHAFSFPKGIKFNDYTVIIGDDLGALCPFGVSVIYEILIELADGRTSPGKHYVMPWKPGSYILLAEETAFIQPDFSCSHFHTETLRSISGIVPNFQAKVRETPWAQIGSALTSVSNLARPSVRRAILSYGSEMLADWRRTLLSKGLPLYLPTSVGGLGWPHPLGMERAIGRMTFQTIHAYQVLRGFRQNPIQFVVEIAKLRCSWYLSSVAEDFSALYSLLRDYLNQIPVSRNADGELDVLTEDYPIGLPNCLLRSKTVSDFIDDVAKVGVSVRYLTAPQQDFSFWKDLVVETGESRKGRNENAYRTVSSASKRYRRACNLLIRSRTESGFQFLRKKTDLLPLIQQDEDLLKNFHIHIGSAVREQFPHLAGEPDNEPELDNFGLPRFRVYNPAIVNSDSVPVGAGGLTSQATPPEVE